MRERALFKAGEEHHRVFQALGRMQGHHGDLAGVLVLVGELIGIRHQRGGFEEASQGGVGRVLLVFGSGGLQLRQILHTGLVLRVDGLLQFLQQPGFGQHFGHDLARLGDIGPGEGRHRRHQITERLQSLRRAGGHALDLLHMHERVEEAGPALTGIVQHDAFGPGTQAALGHVQNTPQVHIVGRIEDGLQVGKRVLDLLALVELGAADELVRQSGVDQRLFQRT